MKNKNELLMSAYGIYLPCKPDCLMYALCLNKPVIACDKLYHFFARHKMLDLGDTTSFHVLRKFFPDLKYLSAGEKDYHLKLMVQ